MTEAQSDALKWLQDHNGDGAIIRGNVVLAAGEIGPHKYVTWRALVGLGRCEIYRAGKSRRIRVIQP